ncbi:zinc-binding dehydrogenase [Diplogelasinospora grovesii]|uniref:Zinc-binding dehydrogenase n=1 Tax=Diplogelasinospora grovesii TaxID=303347 RepID=A0AAN6N7M7_9PEZI|nr:zinc-binding dehydrogenase [Diplogelasinospora grovesii]
MFHRFFVSCCISVYHTTTHFILFHFGLGRQLTTVKKMPYNLTVKKTEGKPGQVYYPLQLNEIPRPVPAAGHVLVRMSAAALNHRDLFIRQHLYPGISFEVDHPMLADGCGTVIELGPDTPSSLLGKRVLMTPSWGWDADPRGPEDDRRHSVIGATAMYPIGTAQDVISLPADEVVPAPEHLSNTEAAALPLTGLTAWRALVTKCDPQPGWNVLVTGIGGGVALHALQFAVALGCNVFVTSSDQGKIDRAVGSMGARAGVSYKSPDWDRQLRSILPEDRQYLDCVVDGAGGDIVARSVRLLRSGGTIACYGMTLGPKMDWSVQAMLKNIELKGSTMGSKKEFRDMVAFVRQHRIVPVVSRVVRGGLKNLEGIEGLFEDMKHAKQFGKLVILMEEEEDEQEGSSPKL